MRQGGAGLTQVGQQIGHLFIHLVGREHHWQEHREGGKGVAATLAETKKKACLFLPETKQQQICLA